MTGHRGYQLSLAGHQAAEAFALTAGFLKRAAIQAAASTPASARDRAVQ